MGNALTATALLARFAVYGRYYEADFGGESYAMRSHLEIASHAIAWPALRSQPADMVVVMMNPGASRPLQDLDAKGWAAAVPDRTQYQLMKLALHTQTWRRPIRHIRVLNLSDLRTPKSALLFELLGKLQGDRHSIFSPARAAELALALGPPQVPVLCAWGMAAALAPLASQALAALAGRNILGLPGSGAQYRHPLPQRADLQQRWLADMQHQIDGLNEPPNLPGSPLVKGLA